MLLKLATQAKPLPSAQTVSASLETGGEGEAQSGGGGGAGGGGAGKTAIEEWWKTSCGDVNRNVASVVEGTLIEPMWVRHS